MIAFKNGILSDKKTFLLWLACLVMLPAFAQQKKNTVLDGIIVKLDNQIILRSELEINYAQAMASGQVNNAPDLKCEILRSLVMNKLMLARADADSVVVPDDQVKGELDRRMAYFVAQIGSEQKLEEYYGKTIKQLKDELAKQVRDQLVMQKMQDNITGRISVTPSEVAKYYNKIPKDSLPYFSTEVEVGQIVKIGKPSRKNRDEARARLEALKKRIEAGEDFATLARQYSEDPGSAAEGGTLGFFKKKELVPEYEAAALKLEPGKLSHIVESQFGFHLIQLIERRGEEFNTRHILIKPAASEIDLAETARELAKLRAAIVKDSISFAKAAKENSDDRETKNNGGLFANPKDGSSYIPLDKINPAVFFIIDTMTVGQISQPMPYRTDDGKEAQRIIYLKSKTPPHQANLKDDYQKISAAALAEKRNNALDEWFEKNRGSVFMEVNPDFVNCNLLQMQN
ncbi:peptidylprolyl isomerase [Adhaeribacter sp. BT258]|uniref:Peptidylprolyl isomerase n=1 Tax=Adhaeribacter terrigena TaxID=2793070 RepID=A0ABS1BX88_9BACT|nr:peptidylprolyl isomerase [Adhaeribacter terrigena]MBK0401482.1 peptidylprolyl isomerase [Adhaeribacter terrigena]